MQWDYVSQNLPSENILTPLNAPSLALLKGEPVLLWFDAKGQLLFKKDKEPQALHRESPPNSMLSMPSLYADDRLATVCWRAKLREAIEGTGTPGNKLLLCRSSRDGMTFGKTQRVNTGGGVLQSYITGNGLGDIYALWIDERASTQYDLYFNVSHDKGESWKDQDIRLDPGDPGSTRSLLPSIFAEGEKILLAWVEGGQNDVSILFRSSQDRGEHWTDPVVVHTQATLTGGLTLLSGARLLIYWYDYEGVHGASSEDDGKTWQAVPDIFKGQDVTELKAVHTQKGNILAVFGIAPQGAKEDIYASVSGDGIRFAAPVRLDTNTPNFSTSTSPEIVEDKSGSIYVIWRDYRNFKPQLFYNQSKDNGRTWLQDDLRVLTGRDLRCINPRVASGLKEGFWLLFEGYENEDLERGTLYLTKDVQGERYTASDRGDTHLERLRERVSKFWSDRLVSDWGGNYDLLDPFYKKRITRDAYISSQFKTIYHAFQIKDIKITENTASVTINYTLEVPEFISASGKNLKVPKRDEVITEEWIWYDGDWFRLFKDLMGGTFIER